MSLFSAVKDYAPIIGGVIEAGGNYFAAEEAASGSDRAQRFNEFVYGQNRKDLKPYRTIGTAALRDMRDIYMTGSKPYTASPGHDFRMREGQKAYDRSGSARGMSMSGRQAKELTRFGQNVAADDYDRHFNRLSSMAGVGQVATNTGVAAGNAYAGRAGTNAFNAAQARGSGYAGVGSGLTSGINNYLTLEAMR
ncbi:hypothetical protein [Denitrobaculum tricleocarpae]|uniref:DNA transfer protein p32 n=1 Tax=Denitrobaculum tricleocarpae TaxID=2591009 RepID=A0A545TSX0_9PROT|nr:hypothetical protein [Denitrobaculum tricleocarpae]TQV80316.1 hypothetical protein FKG95_08970 [Denitrobaculum tricleocarpae]